MIRFSYVGGVKKTRTHIKQADRLLCGADMHLGWHFLQDCSFLLKPTHWLAFRQKDRALAGHTHLLIRFLLISRLPTIKMVKQTHHYSQNRLYLPSKWLISKPWPLSHGYTVLCKKKIDPVWQVIFAPIYTWKCLFFPLVTLVSDWHPEGWLHSDYFSFKKIKSTHAKVHLIFFTQIQFSWCKKSLTLASIFIADQRTREMGKKVDKIETVLDSQTEKEKVWHNSKPTKSWPSTKTDRKGKECVYWRRS